MKIAIIGGGAAGCFCAINAKRLIPESEVIIYEGGNKLLAKVAITGGGRCNVTNSFKQVVSTERVYPRGSKLMKHLLKVFSHTDAYNWFEEVGVPLMTQEDECVFPVSQDAMEIVNKMDITLRRLGVIVKLKNQISDITTLQKEYDCIVVTVGGKPKISGMDFLSPLDIKCVPPVPSLFTFNIKDKELHELMGTVVKQVSTRLSGTKMTASGPLLITHWGMSGPAILKLSSYGARWLAENDYQAELAINWFDDKNEEEVLSIIKDLAETNQKKLLSSVYPNIFIQRHWQYLITKAGLSTERRWMDIGPKQMRKLASMLINDTYRITGKGAYKEEFVTCGGVALTEINKNTLESINYKGIYFAGEVLDIDAITGGFNLQAAWTTGYVVSKAIAEKYYSNNV